MVQTLVATESDCDSGLSECRAIVPNRSFRIAPSATYQSIANSACHAAVMTGCFSLYFPSNRG